MSNQEVKLILASNSPRRAQLLAERGYRFEIIHPPVVEPEQCSRDTPPAHWAEALSYFKARSVAKDLDSGFVLAADTVVALKDHIYGKPRDRDDAQRILRALAGTKHEVITGVSLLDVRTGQRLIRHQTTWVTMRPMAAETLDQYLDTGLWEGKAGAYGIQDRSDANVERLDGSYSNVVGLPMELVLEMLKEVGIHAAADDKT